MVDQDPALGHQAPPAISPFELLAILWRRKLVVSVVILISVVASVALSLRSPKQYSASSELLFREPGFAQALFGTNLFQTGTEEPQRTTQTNIDVVTSLNVAAEAQKLLHTKEPLTSLLGSISVSPSSNANIADITATRSNPEEAAAIANAFANAYITYGRETDRSLVGQAEELVTKSLSTATLAEKPRLESRLRQLRVLQAIQTGNGEVIASAVPNGVAVSPKPKRDGLLGLVVGLLLGCGLALLVDYLDRRLKTLDDVERAYGDYPIIAGIPRSGSGKLEPSQLAGPPGESYRMLRESVRFLDPSGMAKCFVITSADESEGKSTVAVNLASVVAAVGQRVILLEADMRRPTAAAELGARRGASGLSDLLVSDARVEDYLVTASDEPNLSVLPGGTTPPNSADLLSVARMADVIAQAREAADIIIIDSPPLLPVADTRVLLQRHEVDGVIVVARAGASRRDRARAARRVLEQSGRRVFGLVVTGIARSAGDYYHYYDESPQDETLSATKVEHDRGLGRHR
jgi:capsular exopolysaccharide synthesis family protein